MLFTFLWEVFNIEAGPVRDRLAKGARDLDHSAAVKTFFYYVPVASAGSWPVICVVIVSAGGAVLAVGCGVI